MNFVCKLPINKIKDYQYLFSILSLSVPSSGSTLSGLPDDGPDKDSIENKMPFILYIYYIWCDFRTISLAKSVTWYTEYFMYFFHCEETRPLVSIFTYIDAMLLNLEVQVPQQMKRKFVNLSVLKVFQQFHKISKL